MYTFPDLTPEKVETTAVNPHEALGISCFPTGKHSSLVVWPAGESGQEGGLNVTVALKTESEFRKLTTVHETKIRTIAITNDGKCVASTAERTQDIVIQYLNLDDMGDNLKKINEYPYQILPFGGKNKLKNQLRSQKMFFNESGTNLCIYCSSRVGFPSCIKIFARKV